MQIIRNKLGQFDKGSESPKYWLGKKKPQSEETKIKIGNANKVVIKKLWENQEYRKHMSEAHKGQIGVWKGKKLSERHKRNMSEARKKNPVRYWLGKKRPPLSEETKKKIGESNKGHYALKGKDHPHWLGGISFEPYSVDWTDTLKKSIRQRDNYVCKLCGLEPATDVHHIDYDKKNCNPNNLITLCHSCHPKTNNNRNCWIKYFKEKYGN